MYSFYQFNENHQILNAEDALLRFLDTYKAQPEEGGVISNVSALLNVSDPRCGSFGTRFIEDGSAEDMRIPTEIIGAYLNKHEKNEVYRNSFLQEVEYAAVHGEIAFAKLVDVLPSSYIEDLFLYIVQDEVLRVDFFGSYLAELTKWYESQKTVFTVYRSISLSADPAELRRDTMLFDGVGRYWTYDSGSASSYWSNDTDAYSYTLVAQVHASDIDWVSTVYKSLYKLNKEREILMNAESVVKIIDVVYNDKRPKRASTNYVKYVTCGTQAD